MSDTDKDIASKVQTFSDEFSQLVIERHEVGAEEYGSFAFMGNDIFEYAFEELADCANYMRYQYIKLRFIEEELRARGLDPSALVGPEVRGVDEVSSDSTPFSPSKEVAGFLPDAES